MINERLLKAFEECEKFIDEHTPEELIEYEKSLNLDYDRYSSGITFSDYIDLGSAINPAGTEVTYSNLYSEEKSDIYKISHLFCVAA